MAQNKILIVDDDRQIVEVLRCYLENHGFSVACSSRAGEALRLAREVRPDLVLTDADMPGLDGIELCRAVSGLRGGPPVPVVIMSGRKISEEDILSGYGGGADDYILKPFSFPVMLARLNAVLRRYSACSGASAQAAGAGLALDAAGRTVTVDGAPVRLTRKEFDLLALLIEKEGRALSVPYILETVWGYDPAAYNDPHTVEVHVSSLRKKLGKEAAARVVSVFGHGYKFQ